MTILHETSRFDGLCTEEHNMTMANGKKILNGNTPCGNGLTDATFSMQVEIDV
jgi:hypothetical protein